MRLDDNLCVPFVTQFTLLELSLSSSEDIWQAQQDPRNEQNPRDDDTLQRHFVKPGRSRSSGLFIIFGAYSREIATPMVG